MKLKLIAAAAALALSGAANAAIDNGADGSGEFFFAIWDGANSFIQELNYEQSQFTADVAALNPFSKSFSLDPLFQSFISTADLSSLSWNVIAVESLGARTVHQTYTTLPDTGIIAGNARSMVGALQVFANDVNVALGAASSVIQNSTQPGYAGLIGCNNFTFQNFSSCGTLSNNSAADGLGLVVQTANATGQLASVLTPAAAGGNAVKVWLDQQGGAYQLQIAAVPEPETYAMLLAGLGLMGAIARRRRQQQG